MSSEALTSPPATSAPESNTNSNVRDLKPVIKNVDMSDDMQSETIEIAYDALEKFTVEKDKLYMLQTRSGKRTGASALKIARDMAAEGLISREEAILRVEPDSLDQLLHPRLDPEANVEVADVTNCSLSRVHYQSTSSNHRHLHLEAAVRPITVIKWLFRVQGQAALGQSWTLSSQDILLADESQINSHTTTHPVAP